ncbi:MAG: CCDC81-like prokaryotic domain 2 [Bacteroidota bacterium]
MHQRIILAITELLNKSESLEIQGFGRFSKKEVHANFSNNEAVLNAAKHLLVFEVDLNCKDFQLAEHLATQAGITIQEAQNNIEQLVLEWKSALSKGESIDLAQIGTIVANNGIWQLNPVAESPIDAASYGFSPIKIQTVAPIESTIEPQENVITNTESNLVSENKLADWKEKKIAQIKNWNWRNISIASSVFLIAYISLFIVSRPSILSKQKSANLKQAVTASIPQAADTINTAKDSVLNVPVIDTIVPIAQIVKSNRVFKKKNPIAVLAEETIDIDSDSLTDSDTSIQPVEVAAISENIWSPKKYQLVAGVYKNKLAAENAQMNLNFTGFEAKIIKLKKTYRVIIGDYDTLKEAKENLTLANQINPIFYLHIQ